MIKINEKSMIGIGLVEGIDIAMKKFNKINKIDYSMNTTDPFVFFHRDFEDLTESNSLYEGEIEVFYLHENIDLELLDMLLTLIKKETYTFGLRILRKENLLYVYINDVINKNIYFIEDITLKDKMKKSLCFKN